MHGIFLALLLVFFFGDMVTVSNGLAWLGFGFGLLIHTTTTN